MAVLYASISVLILMRAATGSQCREIKRGRGRSHFRELKTNVKMVMMRIDVKAAAAFLSVK